MQTIELTRQQLRETIAELLGWKQSENLVTALGCAWVDPEGETHAELPEWDNSHALAFEELLSEISRGNDCGEGSYAVLTDCFKHGWRLDLIFGHHDGDAPEWSLTAPTVPLAVCLGFIYEKSRDQCTVEGAKWNWDLPELEPKGQGMKVDHTDQFEQEWEQFWRECVTTNGQLDEEKVKNELHDFSYILSQISTVYCEVTGGLLSKPMYTAETILDQFRAHLQKQIDEAAEECPTCAAFNDGLADRASF